MEAVAMSKRTIVLICIALALVWGGTAWIINTQTHKLRRELQTRIRLISHYENLKGQWSPKSQHNLQKRLKTLLRLYRVKPDISRRGGRKIYNFMLSEKSADTVLNKILNMPLLLLRFEVEKADATHLKVRLEVPL